MSLHKPERCPTYEQLSISLNEEDGGCSQQHAHADGPHGIKDAVASDPGHVCGNRCKSHTKDIKLGNIAFLP